MHRPRLAGSAGQSHGEHRGTLHTVPTLARQQRLVVANKTPRHSTPLFSRSSTSTRATNRLLRPLLLELPALDCAAFFSTRAFGRLLRRKLAWTLPTTSSPSTPSTRLLLHAGGPWRITD